MQDGFTWLTLAGCLLLLLSVNLFIAWLQARPDRQELGARVAELVLTPVHVPRHGSSPFEVFGAWEIASDDPGVGGISGLALAGDQFVALTDDGALIRFAKPRGPRMDAFVRELPEGPGTPQFKKNRDSEALVRDPNGRGWWVTFENAGELWLYDAAFQRALERVKLGERHSSVNTGVEGAAVEGADLLLFSEVGGLVTRIGDGPRRTERIADHRQRVSEAANLDPGRILLVQRWVTPLGFRNMLAVLAKTERGYRVARRLPLPGSPIDNFEALAVERTGSGFRLWLMTDDGFEKPFRTLLLALDVERDLLMTSP